MKSVSQLHLFSKPSRKLSVNRNVNSSDLLSVVFLGSYHCRVGIYIWHPTGCARAILCIDARLHYIATPAKGTSLRRVEQVGGATTWGSTCSHAWGLDGLSDQPKKRFKSVSGYKTSGSWRYKNSWILQRGNRIEPRLYQDGDWYKSHEANIEGTIGSNRSPICAESCPATRQYWQRRYAPTRYHGTFPSNNTIKAGSKARGKQTQVVGRLGG